MPRPLLTRSRIVSAGVTIVSELGLSSLTLKATARRVHATPAGVQRQMGTTELTESVVAEIMESMPHVPTKGNWSGRLRQWAVETRGWLAEYRGLAGHLLERRWDPPASLDRLEEVVAVFDATDLTPAEAVMTGITLFWFVLSSADLDDAAPVIGAGSSWPEADAPGERRPRLRDRIGGCSTAAGQTQFGFGLDLLVKGIERRFGEEPLAPFAEPSPGRLLVPATSSDSVLRT